MRQAPPAASQLTPLEAHGSQAPDDFQKSAREAQDVIRRMIPVAEVRHIAVAADYPGIICMFLFSFMPKNSNDERWAWVVVGDLPPACLGDESCLTPSDALEGYIGEMDAWVEAVRSGQPIDDCMPVNVKPTREHADMLSRRLDFLHREILPQLRKDASPEGSPAA